MSKAYFNEFDPHAAAWLRELIKEGHIADGDVDERSIKDVRPSDLEGYTQCHFFAGIGGWSLALRLAGWPDDEPVWTGSCPCQPFSLAGRREGTEDHRDLWPVFSRLITESAPPIVFGEQVESAIRWGWLDRLCDDLEAADYAIGSSVLPACSVGAIHVRQRLWWVACSNAETVERNDSLGESGTRRAQVESQRVPGLHVAGRWWQAPAGNERLPTLVRSFDGLSGILAGFGNAIVPQVAATFIQASVEAMTEAA